MNFKLLRIVQNVDAMESSVHIIDRYFSILRIFGYFDYTTTMYIVAYIALQELNNSHNWDEDCKKFIDKYLNELESKICIISAYTPCKLLNKQNNSPQMFVSDFPDLIQSSDNIFIKELIKIISNYDLFVTVNK